MPVLLREGPYRFYIVSADRYEPPHVHVQRDDNIAKVWINPVRLESSSGFGRTETNRILRIIERNQIALAERWYDHFGY